MKHRIYITIVLAFGFVVPLQSQSLIRNYGFKLGVTSADQMFQYSFDFNIETKRRMGFNIGGYLEWGTSPDFALVTQLEYVQKGVGQQFAITADDPTPIGYETYYWRLDYLSLPLLAKLSLSGESLTPFIMAGPRFDILLGYSQDLGDFSRLYDNFKKTVVGGTVGGGLEINELLSLPFMIEARYNIDFTDSYSTDLLTVRNNSFDIWLGIKL